MIKYSVFCPVHNEEGNISKLYLEVVSVMDKIAGKNWEFIFINDGSRDNSLEEIKKLKRVKIINLKKNYGQAAAMDAGFRASSGEIIISLDADLQNDPSDIPLLLKKLNDEKLDVVCGWRYKRKDPLWMLIITRFARFFRSFLASDGVHDSGCTLRVYRREYTEDLELWGEMHRYIVALLKWRGAKIGEIKVNHRARTSGITKYNWKKSIKGFIDLIYIWFWKKYSDRPLHLFGLNGLILIFLGVLSGIWTVYLKFIGNVSLSDSMWFIMTFFLLLMGIQFFIFGIILDLNIKNYYNTSTIEKRYDIKEIIVKK